MILVAEEGTIAEGVSSTSEFNYSDSQLFLDFERRNSVVEIFQLVQIFLKSFYAHIHKTLSLLLCINPFKYT